MGRQAALKRRRPAGHSLAGQVGRVLHGDEGVGAAGVAHHDDLAVAVGRLVQRAALGLEDLAVLLQGASRGAGRGRACGVEGGREGGGSGWPCCVTPPPARCLCGGPLARARQGACTGAPAADAGLGGPFTAHIRVARAHPTTQACSLSALIIPCILLHHTLPAATWPGTRRHAHLDQVGALHARAAGLRTNHEGPVGASKDVHGVNANGHLRAQHQAHALAARSSKTVGCTRPGCVQIGGQARMQMRALQ